MRDIPGGWECPIVRRAASRPVMPMPVTAAVPRSCDPGRLTARVNPFDPSFLQGRVGDLLPSM